MPSREREYCTEMRRLHPTYEYRFWDDVAVAQDVLPLNVREKYELFYEKKQWAFCADVLRLWVVYRFGGFYIDVDFQMLKPFDDFLPYDGMLMYHRDPIYGEIPNGVFAGAIQHPIFQVCVEKVEKNNHWFGPIWLGTTVKKQFGYHAHVERALWEETMKNMNFANPCWEEWHGAYAIHKALYSWSDLYVPQP